MKTIVVGNNQESVFIGESYLHLSKYLPKEKKTILITDDNVFKYYEGFIRQYPHIIIPNGEASKNWSVVQHIIKQLLALSTDRHSFLVGFGGGVVTDITGFVASIFMRGISFGFVSTSLLSQIDASVGGKNGINFHGYKNLIGSFTLPQFVICDPLQLHTLPKQQIQNGFGELIKHSLIKDARLFETLYNNASTLLALDDIENSITRSVGIKATIVNNDLFEKGERKILNFGHTLGHAIEQNSPFLHGEAIAIGMIWATKFSVFKKILPQDNLAKITTLIEKYKLPTDVKINHNQLLQSIQKDKKKQNDTIDFVFLEEIGKAKVLKISFDELFSFLKQEC